MRTSLSGRVSRPVYVHDEDTAPLTMTRQTAIRMPNLHLEGGFGALFVLDEEVSVDMINEVLNKSAEETGDNLLWLADDTFEQLPNDDGTTTNSSVSSAWRSPFIGKSIEEAFEYFSTIPLDKDLIREYIAVLHKRLYEEKGWVVLYKIDDHGEITSIPCRAEMSLLQMGSYSQDEWPIHLQDWRWKGKPVF